MAIVTRGGRGGRAGLIGRDDGGGGVGLASDFARWEGGSSRNRGGGKEDSGLSAKTIPIPIWTRVFVSRRRTS